MSGMATVEVENKGAMKDILDVLNGIFNCVFCLQLPERPVTVRLLPFFCLINFEVLIFCVNYFIF